jgi:nucleotide-binding universal stress UspA family protein
VAVDGSPSSRQAVDLVAGIAWPPDSAIRVVNVVPIGSSLFGWIWPALAETQTNAIGTGLQEIAQEIVDQARSPIAAAGHAVDTEIVRGHPATLIVQAAREFAADLIVMGTRGHSAIESMLLGSVSEEVVGRAAVPVLISRGTRIERVVLGWDGSDCAKAAAALLSGWSIFAGSTVDVVSVTDVGAPWWTGFPVPGSGELLPEFVEALEANKRQHEAMAKEMVRELHQAGLRAEADPRQGDAATQLVNAAHDRKADLIVTGTHGRTGLERILLGSVARNVLHHAPQSVLIARDVNAGGR